MTRAVYWSPIRGAGGWKYLTVNSHHRLLSAWQQQARALPVDKRLEIAVQARELSAQSKQGKQEYIMDVNQDEVLRVIEEQQVDLLIHGHTHRPGSHTLEIGDREVTRVVLGDWYNTGSVLVADTRGQRLEKLDCQ